MSSGGKAARRIGIHGRQLQGAPAVARHAHNFGVVNIRLGAPQNSWGVRADLVNLNATTLLFDCTATTSPGYCC